MKTRLNGLVVPMALAGLSIAGAQASAAVPAPASTDLLGAETSLAPDPKDDHLLWWEKPGFDWRAYTKVMLDPVEILPREGARMNGLARSKVREVVDGCAARFAEELAGKVEVVERPGPGVLRIRVAVTDIERENAVLNVATSVLLLLRFDLGGTSLDAEFLDAQTGERVAAMRATKSGSVFNLVRGANRYGDARAACRAWARDLEVALTTNP